ncbi:hypothetical protein [Corynebacterium kalidii]|uniref:Uncharacterized protein n=1 Tax=Corynebacterium kalidii TaxID=2931982 RepID=A0A9X1WHH4_9CORY|nr:hypothetical protein [Corynebacterium kalidii]MCJ7858293.1 hypothetical protein [Corynebacterium kalidii]
MNEYQVYEQVRDLMPDSVDRGPAEMDADNGEPLNAILALLACSEVPIPSEVIDRLHEVYPDGGIRKDIDDLIAAAAS